ncbi:hypothetical protein [Corynebacterium sp. HMSC29G08]|uniref:hypothetical protein n=1 Tax=Corynebacterium sp. HMSC29G08 TaxID=1581069 RepID=UPI0008A62C02|nr:hypothetical protein [Corynebacterium sp. HMSC29G08]OFT85118.1 hypothetical protein HMPREF3101_03720 [Corynebacterium sp. HMSC29G08]
MTVPHTITIAGVSMVVKSTKATHVRASTIDGRTYTLRKRSITVSKYVADCDGRIYTARRRGSSPLHKRREIMDADGRLVGTTESTPDGNIELTVIDNSATNSATGSAAAGDRELDVDLGFIAWALSFVDAPINNLRLS